MRILCDTNLLLRSVKPDDPQHRTAKSAIASLIGQSHELVIVPQCCYEFYSVATRPAQQNGLGLSPDEALADVEEFTVLFRLLRDERAIFEPWKALVLRHSVCGKTTHDARIAAAMLRHGVTHLLTFNGADFQRYPHVTVIHPADVAATA